MAGVKIPLGRFVATPFVGLTHVIARVAGYTEDGAAGGNVVNPDHTVSATTFNVSLAGVQSPMTTQTVAVPRFTGHSVSIGAA